MTGPNIEKKGDERLVITHVAPGQDLTMEESEWSTHPEVLIEDLERLIKHQRGVHRHAGRNEVTDRDGRRPWDYLGHEPGRTAWSRHLYDAPTDGTAPSWVGPDSTHRSRVSRRGRAGWSRTGPGCGRSW